MKARRLAGRLLRFARAVLLVEITLVGLVGIPVGYAAVPFLVAPPGPMQWDSALVMLALLLLPPAMFLGGLAGLALTLGKPRGKTDPEPPVN